jgi:hypothetical protein
VCRSAGPSRVILYSRPTNSGARQSRQLKPCRTQIDCMDAFLREVAGPDQPSPVTARREERRGLEREAFCESRRGVWHRPHFQRHAAYDNDQPCARSLNCNCFRFFPLKDSFEFGKQRLCAVRGGRSRQNCSPAGSLFLGQPGHWRPVCEPVQTQCHLLYGYRRRYPAICIRRIGDAGTRYRRQATGVPQHQSSIGCIRLDRLHKVTK